MNKLTRLTSLKIIAILVGFISFSKPVLAISLSLTATSLSASYTNSVLDIGIWSQALGNGYSENQYANTGLGNGALVTGNSTYIFDRTYDFRIRIRNSSGATTPDEIEIISRNAPDEMNLFFQFPSGTLNGTSLSNGLSVLQSLPLQIANFTELRFNDALLEPLTSFSLTVIPAVPEPTSIALGLLGSMGLFLSRWRKRNG